ncbi:MAG: sigma-70 family RNA polymerase sigma factor [Cytophagales bacterium]
MGLEKIKESDVLSLIRTGNGDMAMKFLYHKVYPQVKHFVVQRKGKPDDAFDAFQDALLELYQKVLTGEYPEQFTVCGFLYKMGIYKWLNKNKRDQKFIFSDDLPENEMIETEWLFELKKSENVFEDLFSKIGKKCVELLTHTFIYELSLEETKEKLNFVSIGAVKMQHARCKEKLQNLVNEQPQLKKILKDRIKN